MPLGLRRLAATLRLFATLILALSSTYSLPAHAQEPTEPELQLRQRGAPHRQTLARTRVTSALPETTYVGYTPGHSADNYWSIWGGSSLTGNYHRPPAKGGMWDWEPPYTDVHGDSLQGWWPYRHEMSGTGGLTIDDHLRPWKALDFGNGANYVGPFGPGLDGRKRTFGVVGVWHVDGGNTVVAPAATTWTGEPANSGGVMWAPLEGARSAWMGLRRHGDNTHVDPITGNPFGEDVLVYRISGAVSTGGTDKKFPGYGGYMDQILYRDVMLAPGDTSLTVSFKYRTAMSTGFGTTNTTRTGWFVHDPLTVITGGTNPNFIRNDPSMVTPATPPPTDSLMVYVGAPAEGSVVLSDGLSHTIYDPQRRWFGEVIRSNEGKYKELFSKGGTNAATTATVGLGGAQLAAIRAAGGDRVRLVFRVHTNHVFDDETKVSIGYSSGGVGAAIVDDVKLGTNGAAPSSTFAGSVQGGFNTPTDIDNDTAVDALLAWKSTGKPPQPYFHVHALSSLQYEDICGMPGSPTRICDMAGVVIAMGDHDRNDETGHKDHPYEMEPFDRIISPTIQLCGPFTGPGGVNRMGLQPIVLDDYGDDFYIDYELYTGAMDFFEDGSHWQFGLQAYPAANTLSGTGEHKRWSEIRYPGFTYFNPNKQCFRNLDAVLGNGILRTSNSSGVPDSVRVIWRRMQECYRFGITDCVRSDGNYLDNISFAFVSSGGQPLLSADAWQWIQDTFPFNDSPGLVGVPAAFDTTTALIKDAMNIAPATGNTNRFDVPGDTTVVIAGGADVRIDLVFRILPGPGNYVDPTLGASSQLKALPTMPAPIPTPASGVTNFWANYMYANGAHGSPGGHPVAVSGPLAGQKTWSPHVWNSARCDTAELNVFQIHKRGQIQPYASDLFMTAYHEDELADPHRGALGIARNVCFVADSAQVVPVATVICGSGNVPAGVTYPPAWTNAPGSGKPPSCTSGNCTTKEGTKIIPDGMLTPGSHVQYFFRREDGGSVSALLPDTNVAVPQPNENSVSEYESGLDGHRWQQFGVLPDRWKSPSYVHPVLGVPSQPQCMLVIDEDDGYGDERMWNVVAEALGPTAPNKRGAHNGVAMPVNGDPNDPANFVRRHIGQAGTTWDLYNVKAGRTLNTASGSIGSRYGWRDSTNTQIYGKRSRQGPTHEMLRTYYPMIAVFTGQLNSRIFGPFNNKSQDDFNVLESWLASGSASTPNRALIVQGNGVVEANHFSGAAGVALNTNYLGVTLRDEWYQRLSGQSSFPFDLTPTPAVSPNGNRFELAADCRDQADVYTRSAFLDAETVDGAYYEPFGSGSPYIASVLKQHSAAHPWVSLASGWTLGELTAPGGATSDAANVNYFYDVLGHVFGSICSQVGNLVAVPERAAIDFLRVDGNPAHHETRVRFGLAVGGHAEIRLYDVAGRLVRVLANRTFPAGEHVVPWDGRDAAGQRVASGVYFTRVHQDRGFTDSRKIVILGR